MKGKKFALGVALLSIACSQTGCIVGLFTGNAGMMWTGVGVNVAGSGIRAMAKDEGGENADSHLGHFFENIGFFLDQKNPGRVETMNALPVAKETASKLGVTMDDIAQYNDELNGVHKLNATIENTIKLTSEGKLSKEALDHSASELGFKNGAELKKVLAKNALGQAEIAKIANASGISNSTVSIFLQSRFGVKVAQ